MEALMLLLQQFTAGGGAAAGAGAIPGAAQLPMASAGGIANVMDFGIKTMNSKKDQGQKDEQAAQMIQSLTSQKAKSSLNQSMSKLKFGR